MFVYFIKYANTRHCQSLTSTVNQECYSCRGSMICFLLGLLVAEISMVKVSIALLLCYRCRDFCGKRLCCTAFVLQLKRFYGKSFRCTAFVHGLFDGVKDTNSTSSPPGQSFSSLKQFIGTGHYIL